MALKQEYFDLLDHLGQTKTSLELYQSAPSDHIVALRHDVDHDLDLALEMAHHEWRLGHKATYFLLHTEAYWNDPDFALKIRQLKEYGHEIGLHVNAYSHWFLNKSSDPKVEIEAALSKLRACSVKVKGVCAHGDKLCYEHQFVNNWMWKELRGENPEITEDGISAEGIRVEDETYQISYPKSHQLTREDGAIAELWNLSMREQGIEYDAARLSCDQYWTDSGGSWSRSGNPLEHDFSTDRHQVLVHPWWWRGPTKTIFILSPARSGSKWLANYIEKATSAVGLHEWTLNHTREGNEFPLENRTSREFPSLLEDEKEITHRLKAAEAHHRLLKRDVVECNVYLEGCTDAFRQIFPDSVVIHLQRSGPEIVRSILNRGWYAATEDHTHRTDGTQRWGRASQLERACRYVQSANESVQRIAESGLSFKDMIAGSNHLSDFFAIYDIIVHPLLAKGLLQEKINKNQREPFPEIEQLPKVISSQLLTFFEAKQNHFKDIPKPTAFNKANAVSWKNRAGKGGKISASLRGVTIQGKANNRFVGCFFGCTWEDNQGKGIFCERDNEYNVIVSSKNTSVSFRVFIINFDSEGNVLSRSHQATMQQNEGHLNFVYKPDEDIYAFGVAIIVDPKPKAWKLHIKAVKVEQRTQPREYSAFNNLSDSLSCSDVVPTTL